MPIRKTLNQDFFKKWSGDMAYILGFFAADGTMIRNNRGACFIEFHITDKEILEYIRKCLQSNHKISIRARNRKWKTGYRLQIGSKSLFADLQALGFTPKKSMSICLPKIPNAHTGSFIRGYFDGDGCVYFGQHAAKDRKNPRWVFQTRFTAGSESFLSDLHRLLREKGIIGGFLRKKKGAFELVFSHRDSVALSDLMYNNRPRIYLRRKYQVFCKAIETLYGKRLRA